MPAADLNNRKLERRKRIVRLEKLLLQGVSNRTELAAAFGVSIATVSKDIANVEYEWVRRTRKTMRERRAKRIRQLEAVGAAAWVGHEKATKPQKEVTIKKSPCSFCGGTKRILRTTDEEHVDCPVCDGTGYEIEKTIKYKRQNGDPAMLRVAKDCFGECARLENLYERPMKSRKGEPDILVGHIHAAIDGKSVYDNVPHEAIIQAKLALEAAKEKANGTEPKVIDVVPLPTRPKDDE